MKWQLLLLASFTLALAACGDSSVEAPGTAVGADVNATDTPKDAAKADTEMDTYKLEIKGMMCENCQATVTKLLESMDGVVSANVDHKTGKAIVKVEHGASFDEKAADAVIGKDYELVSCTKLAASN